MDPLVATGGSARICFGSATVWFVIVHAPFPDVPGHVFDSKGAGAEWKCTDRRTFRIAVINLPIAPGKYGVAISEIGQVAAALVIPPWKFAVVVAFGSVLPFRFGRQSILAPL